MQVIAVAKLAAGNGEVGTTWTETAVFDSADHISDVLHWFAFIAARSHSPPELVLSFPRNQDGVLTP